MAHFVFEQLGGRPKLVEGDAFIRCTDQAQIAEAERMTAEKVRKQERQQQRDAERRELECLDMS